MSKKDKDLWFWWYNEAADRKSKGTDLTQKDDCVFAYKDKQEEKVFAIDQIIMNLQELGIVRNDLSREDYRKLWMHLLVVNNDEHLKAFLQHSAADYDGYDFDEDDYKCMREFLAEAVAIGRVKKEEHPEDVVAYCAMVGDRQEGCCFEILK